MSSSLSASFSTMSLKPTLSTQDDICDGYFIPKGSIVHPKEW